MFGGWWEEALRKAENKSDEFSTFKRRVLQVCKSYPGGEKLVPSVAGRVALCIKRKGANIGK